MERLSRLSEKFSFAEIAAAIALASGLLSQAILLVTGLKTPVVGLALGLLVLALFFSVRRGAERNGFVAAALILPFLLWVTISVIWSPSEGYVYEKLAGLLICGFLFWLPIMSGSIHVASFLRLYFVLTVLILAFSAYGMLRSAGDFYSLSDAQKSIYLTAGYFGGGLLVILGFFNVTKTWLADFSLTCFVLLCLLLTGARGPLLFGVLILFVGLIARRRWYSVFALLGIAFSLLLIAQFFSQFDQAAFFIDRAVVRFSLLFEGELSSRTDLWVQMHRWLSDDAAVVMGYGTGSWGAIVLGYDERAYPHNIVLELLFENGVLGFLLFISIFFFSIWSAFKAEFPYFVVILALLSYEFLNLMKSFTISDARMLFFLMGVLLAERLRAAREDSIAGDGYGYR